MLAAHSAMRGDHDQIVVRRSLPRNSTEILTTRRPSKNDARSPTTSSQTQCLSPRRNLGTSLRTLSKFQHRKKWKRQPLKLPQPNLERRSLPLPRNDFKPRKPHPRRQVKLSQKPSRNQSSIARPTLHFSTTMKKKQTMMLRSYSMIPVCNCPRPKGPKIHRKV